MTAPPHRVQDIAETALGDVMSSPPITTTTDTPVSELAETFRTVSGLPVVNVDGKLIGVVSKKDVAKNETVGNESHLETHSIQRWHTEASDPARAVCSCCLYSIWVYPNYG